MNIKIKEMIERFLKKDIIKIDKKINLDLTILGYIDSNITINIIIKNTSSWLFAI